jgi:hypothetical protein
MARKEGSGEVLSTGPVGIELAKSVPMVGIGGAAALRR